MTISGAEITGAAIAYGLGCFSSGYYLVRWKTGQDLRTMGSGSTGGRNVGRVLGAKGFLATVALDAAKGIAAVGGARVLGFRPEAVLLVLLAVVAGHIWPAQLGFHGGKGVVTALGGLLVFDPLLTLGLLGVGGILYGLSRHFLASGLAALAAAPLGGLAMGRPPVHVAGLLGLAVVILLAHRRNIGEALRHRVAGEGTPAAAPR